MNKWKQLVGAVAVLCTVFCFVEADAAPEILKVEPLPEPPSVDLEEILNDPAETRQRLGWIAALRVGTAAGMYYLNSQSVKSQCSGRLCGATGADAIESIQLGMLQTEMLDSMDTAFRTTIAETGEAGSLSGAEALAAVLVGEAEGNIQWQLAALTEQFVTSRTEFDLAAPELQTEATHLLQIGLKEIRTDGNFSNAGLAIEIVGSASLIDLASGEIVDQYTHVGKTSSLRQADWSVGGARIMAEELVFALAQLTEVLTEEVLMVVESPSGKGRGYLLKPESPKAGRCAMGCRGQLWGGFGFQNAVDSLTPAISWEPFDMRYSKDPLNPEQPQPDSVAYDLRIYEAVPLTRYMGNLYFGAGTLLQEVRGIESNEVTLVEPLPACTRLVWTVRARFDVEGRRYLSRWSGHYSEKKVSKMRQVEVADEGKFNDGVGAVFFGGDFGTSRQESAWYYGFRTPPPEGEKRCKW